MWHYSHSQVSLVVADGLAPIWCQDICNYHDDVGQTAHVKRVHSWVCKTESAHLTTAKNVASFILTTFYYGILIHFDNDFNLNVESKHRTTHHSEWYLKHHLLILTVVHYNPPWKMTFRNQTVTWLISNLISNVNSLLPVKDGVTNNTLKNIILNKMH